MSSQENTGGSQNTRSGSAAESARMSYMHAREAAQQVVGQVQQRASEYYEQGKTKAADLRVKVEEAVREHPIRSILITAGAGLLLGMLLRRR